MTSTADARRKTRVLRNGAKQRAAKNSRRAATTLPSAASASRSSHESREAKPQVVEVFSFPDLQIRFEADDANVALRGAAIAATAKSASRRELINRLFSIPALKSLRLNWKKGEVHLEFSDSSDRLRRLSELANAMQRPRPPVLALAHEELIHGDDAPGTFCITRNASGLTLWHIGAPSNGTYRLAHPALRDDFIRQQVMDELATIPGVAPRSVSFPFWKSDSLVVFVQPHRVDPIVFLEALDPVITRCLASGPPRAALDRRDAIVNANLLLAPISDFLFPELAVANATLVIMINAHKVPRAFSALRHGKFTLELLSVYVAALAIISTEFFPAAIVYWLMRFWPRRANALYKLHHTRFVNRYQLRPRRVWTDGDGVSVETRVEELTPSSIVTLNAGDIVPGDGVVVEGSAKIDEHLLTGSVREQRKIKGSTIHATNRIVDGSLRMKIKMLGEHTAASRIARWHQDALQRRDVEPRTRQLAQKLVAPTLLASAVGFFQGGLNIARAAVRPDYTSGPVAAETLDSLKTIIRAANRGILIAGDAPLEKLSGPACVVFDDTISWQTSEQNGEFFSELARSQGITETVFFGSNSEAETESVAASLGFDLFAANTTSAQKSGYIARKQKEGHVVIYIGNTLAEREVAYRADVAIAVLKPPFADVDKATIALLSPELLKFLELRAIAADALKETRTAFNISLVPNIATVLAAFFVNMPFYAALLWVNAGTVANYFLSKTQLQLAEAETFRT